MPYSVVPYGSPSTNGSGFGQPPGPLTPVIVNNGYVSDNSDASYVDSVVEVYTHFSNGQDRLNATNLYSWNFTPATSAPPYSETSNHLLKIRAKLAVIEDNIHLTAGGTWWLGFDFARSSDGLALTSAGNWFVAEDEYPLNEPRWFTFTKDLTSGTVDPSAPWESLRTGVFPGYGPIRLGFGFQAQPGFTGAPSPVGTQSRFRLYEMKWTLQPGGPTVGEDHVGI